jgi:hypothetical protein
MAMVSVVVTLPDGSETFGDVEYREGDRLESRERRLEDFARKVLRESSYTTHRSDPKTVSVKVESLVIVKGVIARTLVRSWLIQPPVLPMTADEFEAEMVDVVDSVPEPFRVWVRGQAWDRGHSAGYEEVVNIARDLADSLAPVVQDYFRLVTRR